MGFSYFPHTAADIGEMLKRIGVDGLDDLYADVPRSVIFDGDYDLPDAMSEMEVRRRFEELDRKSRHLTIMAGGGAYDHYAPAVVPALTSRSEYLTAYTPYQAEISQGTLRYIFEFQSMIATLTGMDCANASMYDGATAAAEAMMMAMAATRKKTRVLLSSTLLPQVREVVHTYAKYHGVELSEIASADGQTDIDDARRLLEAGDVAGVLVPSVNRFGIVEDLSGFAEAAHAQKALLMVYADPSALAATPRHWAFRWDSAALMWVFWHAARSTCANCRDASSERRTMSTVNAPSCLRFKRANSTSAAKRPTATSAPTSR